MAGFHLRPDPLIDSLPSPIREAYRAAERVLMNAENVHLFVVGSRVNLLVGAIGRLHAFRPEETAAVLPAEADLAAARGLEPFVAMGQTFTTAHLAALDYGSGIAGAIDRAAHPKEIIMVDAWGAEGAALWADAYREHLLKCAVVATQGDMTCPGPEWEAFRRRFLASLPNAETDALKAQMRLEIASWVKAQKTRQGLDTHSGGAGQGEEWLPASTAVERAEGAGFPVSLSWLSRLPAKSGVKTRPKQLTGNHQREVEWNSLVGYLARKKAEGRQREESTGSAREEVENEKKKAGEKKRRDRSID